MSDVRLAPEPTRPTTGTPTGAANETDAAAAAVAAAAAAEEAHAVLARLERYVAHHPPRRTPVRVVHTQRGDVEEPNDTIGLLLATAAQPVAVICCIATVLLFEHANHTVAAALGVLLGGAGIWAAARRIPMSVACSVGIVAGLAIGLFS